MRRITVFGSSTPKPGDRDYDQALSLGRILGQAGYTVLTGGYIGSMEAVSRGAAENGGYVIGVTCDEIESWRPVRPNSWLHEEKRFPSLRERIYFLTNDCDGALALPGGLGTLTEIAFMWNHILTGAIHPRPLILIGSGWKRTIQQLYHSLGGYIPQDQREWILFAQDIDNAFYQLELGI